MPSAGYDGARRGGLAGLHAGAGECYHGDSADVEFGGVVQRFVADFGWNCDALTQVGESQRRAQDFAVERLTLVRRCRVANAKDTADVEHLDHLAGRQRCGYVTRVAEQRFAMSQSADHDIAARYFGHAAAGKLQRVVSGFVVQDLDHQHDAFLARDLRCDANFVR